MNSVSPLSITTGLLAGSAVLPEMVAESVLERASAVSADLIVIATHGRGTLSRLVYGSVAHELVRRSNVPVLLIPLGESAPQLVPEPQFTNVLIPLDGSPLAEKVLSPAFDLARLMEARCTLVRVLESDSRPADPALGWVQAQRYLDRIAGRIQGGSLDIRTRLAASARVATTIREQAEREPGSIIAIATHGWGGFRQLLLGSVAEQLIQNASSPILAYRPADRG